MKEKPSSKHFLIFLILLFLWVVPCQKSNASPNDSLQLKKIKAYIRPCFYFNHYGTPQRRSSNLKHYRFAQNDIGFYLPLFTNTWFHTDSVSLSSIHLLLSMDLIRYKPNLAYLNESYTIGRFSTGVRLFYVIGQKNVFYFAFAPFFSQEFSYTGRYIARFTGALIYSRTVSKNFAYRFGLARTYTYGRVLFLPVAGVRVGAIDKIHANIQFPRNVSLDLPLGGKTWFSVFSRTVGGIYNVQLQDSLVGPAGTLATLKRFELLNGVQFSFRTGDHLSFYLSAGFVTRRYVRYNLKESASQSPGTIDLTSEKIPASIFLGFGLSLRFGKAKKVYNNTTMYDMFDMNTLYRTGAESGPADNEVPTTSKKQNLDNIKGLKYKDVEDLVTDEY